MTFCQVSDGDVVPKDIVLLNLGPQFWLFCFHWIHWTTQRKSDDLVVLDLMVLNLLFSDFIALTFRRLKQQFKSLVFGKNNNRRRRLEAIDESIEILEGHSNDAKFSTF